MNVITKEQQRRANSIARKNGYGRATEVIIDPTSAPKVIRHTPRGFRKKTTGQYVPNAYRSKFGWKNTYYQHAETVVSIPS